MEEDMMKTMSKYRAVVMLVLLLGFIGSTAVTPATAFNSRPAVLPPDHHPFGMSYEDWSVRWWKWVDSIPAEDNPILDQDGSNCDEDQSGPVWFLAGTTGGAVKRKCTMPAGKAIFFPIINILNDFPCPDPNFKPAPGQSLEDFLTEGARAVIDLVDERVVEVDGIPLPSFRATSKLFTFRGDPSLTPVLDPCITGRRQKGVSDGYWIMLAPLSRGTHTIHFRGGISSFPLEVEATYELKVKGEHGEH
jgi:hypothetical protein